MRSTALHAGLMCLLLGTLACGPRTAMERERQVSKATEQVEEGGVSPFQARLSFRAPETMAIQEVPYAEGKDAEARLWNAVHRYRAQWTMALTIEPKPNAKPDPQHPLALDIENNGGMWGDYSRNLNRVMFEMGGYIRLRTKDGQEVEPVLVEFQRSFGMGQSRTFLLVFPKISNGKPVVPPFEVQLREFGQGLGVIKFTVDSSPSEFAFWRLKRLWKTSARE